MELQFSKNTFPYLRRAVWEVKNEEQTQEVKLTDSLPDIGRILGAWGQPLIRSKEWRGNSMAASGGVMAWKCVISKSRNIHKSLPNNVEKSSGNSPLRI